MNTTISNVPSRREATIGLLTPLFPNDPRKVLIRAKDKAASRTWKTCPRLAINVKSDQKSFSALWRSPSISRTLGLSEGEVSVTSPRGKESTVRRIN